MAVHSDKAHANTRGKLREQSRKSPGEDDGVKRKPRNRFVTLIPAPICSGPGSCLLSTFLVILAFDFMHTSALRCLICIYTLSTPLNLLLSFEKGIRVALERALAEQEGAVREHGTTPRE